MKNMTICSLLVLLVASLNLSITHAGGSKDDVGAGSVSASSTVSYQTKASVGTDSASRSQGASVTPASAPASFIGALTRYEKRFAQFCNWKDRCGGY